MNFSIDENTMKSLRRVYPLIKEISIFIITEMWRENKIMLRVTQGFRSLSQQEKLYNKGRESPGIKVTNAKAGLSYHNYGLAVDFCFRGRDPYLENHPKSVELWSYLGKLIEDSGCYWGGLFRNPDKPHMELRVKGFTPKDCFLICEKYGIRGLWIELDRALGREPGERYDLIPEWGE